jgi:hypothetical protein
MIAQAIEMAGEPVEKRKEFVRHSYATAEKAEAAWLERVRVERVGDRNGIFFRMAWRGFNRSMPDME